MSLKEQHVFFLEFFEHVFEQTNKNGCYDPVLGFWEYTDGPTESKQQSYSSYQPAKSTQHDWGNLDKNAVFDNGTAPHISENLNMVIYGANLIGGSNPLQTC